MLLKCQAASLSLHSRYTQYEEPLVRGCRWNTLYTGTDRTCVMVLLLWREGEPWVTLHTVSLTKQTSNFHL